MVNETAQRTLYPEITPFQSGHLNVSDRHSIYVEQCGNPKGKPVIIVHGGPGGGCNPSMRRYHDPDKYHIILFDQRGCGRSLPYAEIRENTTWDLVADMEKIRTELGIEKWQVFGGSWGSTLSLAYGETHPQCVSELVLRGIFLLRKFEIEWFYQEGASNIFPDRFEAYRNHIPQEERGDMISAYYRRLTSSDPDTVLKTAKIWSAWEGSSISLLDNKKQQEEFTEDHFARAFARIECHYFYHRGFLKNDGWLLENATRLQGIPGAIIHGRYDIITPLVNAWDLAKVWTNATLNIIPACGHAMTEPGIINALIQTTDQFAAG